ncbi:ead/Ea22-like family protein [Escherichia coli]|uniref:ead/Ea22-like family protein n=1 Tax=Escherichia coli TaxID=562 RepID=UPI0005A8DCC9|nr:ead/Ea22-like family protein [Escherichia coli]EHA4941258.1 ead/Ea22-like family protein [Escherichia coli]MCN2059251.1 ead/Ea22-like family protein [Escherichia coli]MCN2399678.1 ead/Ea22-like family protein [Escherichia coli]MCN9519023.1 ead/Ea22-like family protein [Escherichia coli]MCO0469486.1 ead/Ea22-like family protein [Escherichia coli]
MSKIDYQALREAAEKATCGEWSLEYGEGRFDGDDALIHREAAGYIPICRIEGAHPESGFDEDFQMEQQANAEFIAAASPATVLALLDENESMCRDLIARNGEIEGLRKLVAELEETKSKLNEQREYYEGVISDGSKRIAELESDSQAQKLVEAIIVAIENEQERLFDEDYLMDSKECIDVIREEVKRWNDSRAAGIRIKGDAGEQSDEKP